MSAATLPAFERLVHFGAPSASFLCFLFFLALLADDFWNASLSESFEGWCTFVTFIVTEQVSDIRRLARRYGVTKKSKIEGIDKEGHLGFRNVPSGGGLYPLEMYIVLFNAHIPLGLYHYRPDINCLEEIKQGLFLKELSEVIQAEPYVNIQNASAVLMTTGLIERQNIKYGERAYRFLMQESGAVGQNISLIAETLNLGTCWVGGYLDDKLNEFIGIDGVFETVNNVIIIGEKQEKTISN